MIIYQTVRQLYHTQTLHYEGTHYAVAARVVNYGI